MTTLGDKNGAMWIAQFLIQPGKFLWRIIHPLKIVQ